MITSRPHSLNQALSSAHDSASDRVGGVWGEQFSIYLDLVRFLAATYVMLAHTKYPRFTDGWLNSFGYSVNDAVMVFFVLSGLVIAHVTLRNERGFGDYVIARLSRLWSVALPALVVGLLVDSVGTRLQPSLYAGAWYAADHPIGRLLANAGFLGEIWFVDFLPFSNVPYWSINYEFWYYAIFAAFVFTKGWKRYAALTLCALISGPKILLLLPVWLMGVATHQLIERGRPSLPVGLSMALLAPLAYALYTQSGIHGHLGWMASRWLGSEFQNNTLSWSKSFLSNYVVGFLVLAHFLGMAMFLKRVTLFPPVLARLIRTCAGYTFSIYLLHVPLLHFSAALIALDPSSKVDWLTMLSISVTVIILVGSVTEHKKHMVKKILLRVQQQCLRIVNPYMRSAQT